MAMGNGKYSHGLFVVKKSGGLRRVRLIDTREV